MDTAVFIPRILTYSCVDCSQEVKDEVCVSGGKYCLRSDREGSNGIEVMKESLREKCIYNRNIKAFRDDEHIFFTYLYKMRFDCLEVHNTIGRDCADQIMVELGVDPVGIE